MVTSAAPENVRKALRKTPTGISGLDEITLGGLPAERTTLLCGGTGCGKTLLGIEFLVRGATRFGEPGVLIAFEETSEELTQNVASLGYDLDDLCARGLLFIDHVHVDRAEIEETGEYDLEALFIRLDDAIRRVGAKRVVLDTLEALFAGLRDQTILRAELRRLFRWLKDRGVTAVATAERGEGTFTRHGLEEYVSDCVILLDHRILDQISTRRLQIVKYRGSHHGTNEYPFLIDETGISVFPITSVGLDHPALTERVSTGIADLDAMLDGGGFYRGSSVLVSGTAGAGKTSVAAHFAQSGCRRGERVLYFAFEESPSQIIRNMRSVGIDLAPWIDDGLLCFHATRPTSHGLETHLATIFKAVTTFEPRIALFDPITNLIRSGTSGQAGLMLARLIDFLKTLEVTALYTSLLSGGRDETDSHYLSIFSTMDTWLGLDAVKRGGERRRSLTVLKSRGMNHSSQVRELRFTDHGIDLIDPAGLPKPAFGSAEPPSEADP